jgi:hypothetical protein
VSPSGAWSNFTFQADRRPPLRGRPAGRDPDRAVPGRDQVAPQPHRRRRRHLGVDDARRPAPHLRQPAPPGRVQGQEAQVAPAAPGRDAHQGAQEPSRPGRQADQADLLRPRGGVPLRPETRRSGSTSSAAPTSSGRTPTSASTRTRRTTWTASSPGSPTSTPQPATASTRRCPARSPRPSTRPASASRRRSARPALPPRRARRRGGGLAGLRRAQPQHQGRAPHPPLPDLRAQTEEERLALARAAEREYRFLQGIDHPGIEKPTRSSPTRRARRWSSRTTRSAAARPLPRRARRRARPVRPHRAGPSARRDAAGRPPRRALPPGARPNHVTVTPDRQAPALRSATGRLPPGS